MPRPESPDRDAARDPSRRDRVLVAAAVIGAFVLAGGLGGLLADRLVGGRSVGDIRNSSQIRFRVEVSAACQQHRARVLDLAQRGYASTGADRLRVLEAFADAVSAVEGDLRRLDPPPPDASSYSRLLDGLKEASVAYRAAAAEGGEAPDPATIVPALVARERWNIAAITLATPACRF